MPKQKESSDVQLATPDPALQRLSRLIGKWSLKGKALGAKKNSIKGTTTFKWLHGKGGKSFFLVQDMLMDYDGLIIKSHEIIAYDPESKAFSSNVYSNMAEVPWPYQWDIKGDNIRISIKYDEMNATFKGKFSSDAKSFSGGWRPNPGADKKINAPYDIIAERIK